MDDAAGQEKGRIVATADQVRVVIAADDNYARPLTVTGRSVIDNLAPGRRLELFVLDNGIGAANRALILESLRHEHVEVRWIEDVGATLAGLPTYGFFTTAAYSRLLIPELLPADVERVLYLDSDTLVRHDVGALYDLPFQEFAALGVPDSGAPFVACPMGLPLWYENGRRADEFNINSGVLLINLDLWRREGIGQQTMDYLRSDRYQLNVDQEAINAVIGMRIGTVDPHWNQQGELYDRPCELALPYPRDVVQSLKDDPWIIHYSTANKPWHRNPRHPWAPEWYRYLDRTAFAGWRPPKPSLPARMARWAAAFGRKTAKQFGWN